MFDIITIGDSTLDVFLQIHEATVSCQINKEKCLFCLEYAEKIPVDSVVKIPGAGNASNAAVGARRLGLKSAIVSVVGKDEIGEEILEGWEKARVSTAYVIKDPEHVTNYSTVLNFKGERTILVRAERRKYLLPPIDGTRWVYYTALGPGHEKLEKQLLAHLKRRPEQNLAFNPGTGQLRRGLNAIKPVIARSDLFIVNKQEAEHLLGNGERPIHNLLLHFLNLGAKKVVITDGSHGSHATDGKHVWSLGIFKGPIVERTGAGDSYATAFLCSLYAGKSVPEAMRAGTANAWSVVQYVGPLKGLLTKTQMAHTLKRFAHMKPKTEALMTHV